MSETLKYLKKGSVARFREFYNKVIKKPLTPKQREELLEIFQKKEKPEVTKKEKPKMVAKTDRDLGI